MNIKRSFILTFLISSVLSAKTADKPIFKLESPFKKIVHFVHNPDFFFQAVDATEDFLNKIHLSKFMSLHAGVFEKHGITIDDVKRTLHFVKEILQTAPEKMSDMQFLEEHFIFHRWYVKSEHGHQLHGHYGPPDYIRTTSYLITQISGSLVRKSKYVVPLYSVPTDEKKLAPLDIKNKKTELLRFKYTRQEIIDGVFDKNPEVTLLGWVTLEDYKEIVKQGSAIIVFKRGLKKLCSLAKNNGKSGVDSYYFFSIKDKSVDPKKTKFPIKPDPVSGITLAGNVEGLGFGKLFLMVSHDYRHNRLEGRYGLLTDTGEAFKNNYHQVDQFVGYFAKKKDFEQHILGIPHTARMYLMIKRPPLTKALT